MFTAGPTSDTTTLVVAGVAQSRHVHGHGLGVPEGARSSAENEQDGQDDRAEGVDVA